MPAGIDRVCYTFVCPVSGCPYLLDRYREDLFARSSRGCDGTHSDLYHRLWRSHYRGPYRAAQAVRDRVPGGRALAALLEYQARVLEGPAGGALATGGHSLRV